MRIGISVNVKLLEFLQSIGGGDMRYKRLVCPRFVQIVMDYGISA